MARWETADGDRRRREDPPARPRIDPTAPHPDLVEVADRMRRHLGRLQAAQAEAAAVMLRRTRTIRDRLLAAEDRGEILTIRIVTGEELTGRVEVCADHVIVHADGDHLVVGLAAIATFGR